MKFIACQLSVNRCTGGYQVVGDSSHNALLTKFWFGPVFATKAEADWHQEFLSKTTWTEAGWALPVNGGTHD